MLINWRLSMKIKSTLIVKATISFDFQDNGIDEIVKIVVHHFEQIKIKIQQNYDSLKSELEHKVTKFIFCF